MESFDESMDVAGFDSSPYAACQCDTRSPHDEDDGSWMDTLSDNESRWDIHDDQEDAATDDGEEVDSETNFTGDEDSRIDGTTDAEAAHDLADNSDDESRDDVRSTVDNSEGDTLHTEDPRLAVEAAVTWDHQGHEYSAVSPRCAEVEDICEEKEDAVETVETDDVPNEEPSSTCDEPQRKNDGNSDKRQGGSYDDTSDDGDTLEASDDYTWSQHTEDEDVVFLYSADAPRAPQPVFRVKPDDKETMHSHSPPKRMLDAESLEHHEDDGNTHTPKRRCVTRKYEEGVRGVGSSLLETFLQDPEAFLKDVTNNSDGRIVHNQQMAESYSQNGKGHGTLDTGCSEQLSEQLGLFCKLARTSPAGIGLDAPMYESICSAVSGVAVAALQAAHTEGLLGRLEQHRGREEEAKIRCTAEENGGIGGIDVHVQETAGEDKKKSSNDVTRNMI